MDTAANLPKQDQDLLTTFIAVRFNLIELATHTHRPLLVLQDWALQPQIQAQIARYRALEKLQHQTQAADARAAGINSLLDLLTESPDPIERRRAAQTLIRVGADAPPEPEAAEPLSADEEFDRDLEEEDESNELDESDELDEADEQEQSDDPKPPTQNPTPTPTLSLTPQPPIPPTEIPPTFSLPPPHNPQNGQASATS